MIYFEILSFTYPAVEGWSAVLVGMGTEWMLKH